MTSRGDKIAYNSSNIYQNPLLFIFIRKGSNTPIPSIFIASKEVLSNERIEHRYINCYFDNERYSIRRTLNIYRNSFVPSYNEPFIKATGTGYTFLKVDGDIGPIISRLKKGKTVKFSIEEIKVGPNETHSEKNISLRGSSNAINYSLGIKVKKSANNVLPLPPLPLKTESKSNPRPNFNHDSGDSNVFLALLCLTFFGIFIWYVLKPIEGKKNNDDLSTVKNKKSKRKNKEEIDLDSIPWNANGSGLILSKEGYIATNSHVVTSEEKTVNNIGVEFNYLDEIKTFNAKLVKNDFVNDLAIIKIDDKKFKGLQEIPFSARNEEAELGEEVFALGYPLALSLMGTDIKFTDGRISSKTGFRGNISTYQSTAPIQPGNSGGPLFDFKGNLLGINSSGLSKEIVDNVSYTIKTSYLKSLLNVLPKKITLPTKNSLEGLSYTEKIKILTKYVALIKIELK